MPLTRRDLLLAGPALAVARPARAATDGPVPPDGLMFGDVTEDRAVVWCRADRPARLIVRWQAATERGEPHVVRGPLATPATDLCARVVLSGLPADATLIVSCHFEDARTGAAGPAVNGRLRTAPRTRRDVRFVWSGDICGQGWGIDESRGGYRIFQTILRRDPDLFVFSGDRIYADSALKSEVALPDGTVWRNLLTEPMTHVAETLDDFRARYRYNHLDANFRDLLAQVPLVAQWDDHEVYDNWAHGGWMKDDRYLTHDLSLLALRARAAWGEYTPMAPFAFDWARLYRHLPYGPLLDLFVLDGRSYRAPNGDNDQAYLRPDAAWLGRRQLDWLKHRLRRSDGLWKVICIPQPISLVIWDDWRARTGHDGVANAPGLPSGRELEIEDLFRFLHQEEIKNVVFLSADVHFSAAIELHPDRASFHRFFPMLELVTGPLHAGTFGPGELDPTFGPELRFTKHAPPDQPGIGPWSDHQFFGEISIDGQTGVLDARFFDLNGGLLHTETRLPDSAPRARRAPR